MRLKILAGDIGGTNARLALFEPRSESLVPLAIQVYPSREYDGLKSIIMEFHKTHDHPIGWACLGIAGPVRDGRVETANLAWTVDSRELASVLGVESVSLINDLEANAYGIEILSREEFIVLNEGARGAKGNRALISAGTGLGEAGLHLEGDHYTPLPSEGGHADFSPRNDMEIELLRYLLRRHDRVSCERVISGPGLYNIYNFLKDTGRAEEPDWLAEEMKGTKDPPAVITALALDGKSELCVKALDMFVSALGAEAGNLALRVLATGGVYVGGGIAPRIIKKLKEPFFMEAFAKKGRMKQLLEDVPVCVLINDRTALLGAARYAYLKMSGKR